MAGSLFQREPMSTREVKAFSTRRSRRASRRPAGPGPRRRRRRSGTWWPSPSSSAGSLGRVDHGRRPRAGRRRAASPTARRRRGRRRAAPSRGGWRAACRARPRRGSKASDLLGRLDGRAAHAARPAPRRRASRTSATATASSSSVAGDDVHVGAGDAAGADDGQAGRLSLAHRLHVLAGHGRGDAAGEEVDVLVGHLLVPAEHEHLVEPGERAGEALGRVVEGLGPGQVERPVARAEGDLLGDDLAAERRLVDVPGRRGDVVELERGGPAPRGRRAAPRRRPGRRSASTSRCRPRPPPAC